MNYDEGWLAIRNQILIGESAQLVVVIWSMNQVLVCIKNEDAMKISVLDERQKILVALGNVIKSGNTEVIAAHVKKSLDSGWTKDDILDVVSCIVGNKTLVSSIIELLTCLSFEEANRHEYIDVFENSRKG